jgi:hypothetical protein
MEDMFAECDLEFGQYSFDLMVLHRRNGLLGSAPDPLAKIPVAPESTASAGIRMANKETGYFLMEDACACHGTGKDGVKWPNGPQRNETQNGS